jgi:putative acetyltransferase
MNMDLIIEAILPKHDRDIQRIIKSVGAEFGAIGDGFGPSDPEVDAMSQHYGHDMRSGYFIASVNGRVIGGGGIAPFNGKQDVCELKKLFIHPEGRGLGLGKSLTQKCLMFAKESGYKTCYLDTLLSMKSAIRLYEKMGFIHLTEPMQGTIHNGCDVWMLKTL